uniref:Polypeptide N-acetylgalactosaminyltransferase n=1 Tax=Timema tahoe TaxID=61484 RepID=A0A7R9IS18_9NEOP|nr:unnamed protein product [Timema tahoe]
MLFRLSPRRRRNCSAVSCVAVVLLILVFKLVIEGTPNIRWPFKVSCEWSANVYGRQSRGQNQFYEALIDDDSSIVVPRLGEGGVPVILEGEELLKAEASMKKEALNLYLSDRISLTRNLVDPRNPLCKKVEYDQDLPTASVIVIFTNEGWSTLLRTVHSVLNRSPERFLKEVILVDDFSDREELGEKLEYYVRSRFTEKVQLLRMSERSGLVRTRLAGAKVATGDVLVFLDSHCEVTEKWLKPLLQRVKDNPTSIAMPIIDWIDNRTFEYRFKKDIITVVGFNWSGYMLWVYLASRHLPSPIAPAKSPAMAGGLFAIGRDYFWHIGSYDEGMNVWGGENLEMSFRVWQCGGSLEVIPCSRVGHVFRSWRPYDSPGGRNTYSINTMRMAEVWMDDYKRFIYLRHPEWIGADYRDISERLAFRKARNCKSFKWYLHNVYPSKFILDENVRAHGSVSNSRLCLDTLQRENFKSQYVLGVYLCNVLAKGSQYFSLSNSGELRREYVCAEIQGAPEEGQPFPVTMYPCHGQGGNQEWTLTDSGQVRNTKSGLCLDAEGLKSDDSAVVAKCSDDTPTQEWVWENYCPPDSS